MTWLREPNSEPIPGYRLLEPLGSGGFGEVWKCEAPGGLHKAIKFVYGNLNSLDVDAVRAEQEKHALERIKTVRHPFICTMDLFKEINGELVIVMELADKTLHDRFQECLSAGQIGIQRDELLCYLRDAAEALDWMYKEHQLQHLDIKPRNLFIQSNRAKVADFGLVKSLERRSASGILGGVTPLYAAPETFNGKISEHSDQYSLAIVYTEMLTGHRPFTGKNVRQLAQQHLQADPDLRALPEAERPVVARALSKDPSKRFPNCMSFVRALYAARVPAKVADVAPRAPALVGSNRPKTLHDSLEDVSFELPDELPEEEFDARKPPVADDSDDQNLLEAPDLGVTVAQPDTGALRPTLFIGLGGFGRKALLELRCRIVDRFGDLGKVPILRFLCIDTDPEAVNTAVKGAPEVALTRNEVYHLPLQPVSNYRKRTLDKLEHWLPIREKLYAMPRSLQPQGSRALGRLAYVDNHQRLLARVKREIQETTNADLIYHTVNQTGLALRDTTPRVYIITSAGGGSSGMLLDLSYATRRMLNQLRHPDAELNVFLLCSAPTDPASPKAELANVFATLTEIHHYSDPSIPFTAEYGEEQRLVDHGSPAGAVYLLPLPHRGPNALGDTVAHLGSYLFHEVTTPLGMHLGNLRKATPADSDPEAFPTPFRSFGTYAVWFPRGLLLRLASRLTCRKLLEGWLSPLESGLPPDLSALVNTVCEQVADDPQLATETLLARIEEATRDAHLTDLGATPAEAITGLLSTLEEQSVQSVAQEDPGNWSRQALNRIRDWVGDVTPHELHQDWRKTRVNRALLVAAKKVAEDHGRQLAEQWATVMRHPGARLAAAESAVTAMETFCTHQANERNEYLSVLKAKTGQAWAQLEQALAECYSGGGGFRIFGGRSSRRLLHGFMERLSFYARCRLQEETIAAVQHFFIALRSQLLDQKRDLGFCRQRLRHLQENLELAALEEDDLASTRPGAELTLSHSPVASTEAFWEAIRQSHTARVVLPEGEKELERAAVKLLHRLKTDDWVDLDKELDERVLQIRGGLFPTCMKSGDLTRNLAAPLMNETITLLGEFLPVMDVAQILGAEFGFTFDQENSPDNRPPDQELAEHTKNYLKRAAPLLGRGDAKHLHAFLLLPASPAGRGLSKAVEAALADLRHVKVPGQSDLMFCCDQGPLTPQDLQQMFKACSKAYRDAVPTPVSSPHCRFDLMDWMPLDP
jgi:serine/threonine protein kinase